MAINAKLVKELREISGAGMMDCKNALENTSTIEDAIQWLKERGIVKAAKKQDRIAAEGIVAVVQNDTKLVLFEVNSETDFVAKNDKFLSLIETIKSTILANEVKDLETLLKTKVGDIALEDVITNAVATIGEKITLRRVQSYTKNSSQSFGSYVHSNQRIGVALLFDGAVGTEEAKQVSMHIAAMNPTFIDKSDINPDFVAKEKQTLIEEVQNDPKNSSKPEQIIEKMVEGRLNKRLAELCLLDQQFVVNPDLKVRDFIANQKATLLSLTRFEVGEGIEKQEVDFATEVMSQVK